MLDLVGLPRSFAALRYPHELGGSASVPARAPLLRSALIIADEAVAALDVSIRAQTSTR